MFFYKRIICYLHFTLSKTIPETEKTSNDKRITQKSETFFKRFFENKVKTKTKLTIEINVWFSANGK